MHLAWEPGDPHSTPHLPCKFWQIPAPLWTPVPPLHSGWWPVGGGCIGEIRWSLRLSPFSSRLCCFTLSGADICAQRKPCRESVAGVGVGVEMGPAGRGASVAPLRSQSGQSPAQRLGPGQSLPLWLQSPCWPGHNGVWTGWFPQSFVFL